MSGCSECAAYGSDRLQLNYSDRRSLPPWRGEHVKFAHRRERVFHLAVIGLIRSFRWSLSSAFLGDPMFSFGETRFNLCGRSHGNTRSDHGVRKIYVQSIGICWLLIYLCVSWHCARIGLRVDSSVLPLANITIATENNKSMHSSTLM